MSSVHYAVIGLDNGLSRVQHKASIWTNIGLLVIRHMGTNFAGIRIKVPKFLPSQRIWNCRSVIYYDTPSRQER